MRMMFVPGEVLDDSCNGGCGDCDCEETQKLPEQAIQAECMQHALAAFQWPCTKKIGQILTFKKGIHVGLTDFPKDTIFIIAEVFDPPLDGKEDVHSTSFGRKTDLGLLAYQDDGSALWICMDSRFFEDCIPEANA